MKRLKKIISMLLCLAVMVSVVPTAFAADEVLILVNGAPVTFTDVKPQVIEGRTLVPLRSIGDALGAYVAWRESDTTVHVFKNGVSVMLTIGSPIIEIRNFSMENDFVYTSRAKSNTFIDPSNPDIVARTINGRTMVPLRAIAEAFGGKVGWVESTNAVTVEIPATDSESQGSDKYAAYFIEQMNYYPQTKILGGDVKVKINAAFSGAAKDFAEGMEVTIAGQTMEADSDSECYFENVEPGTHTVEIDMPMGFKLSGKSTVKVTVTEGEVETVNINITKR